MHGSRFLLTRGTPTGLKSRVEVVQMLSNTGGKFLLLLVLLAGAVSVRSARGDTDPPFATTFPVKFVTGDSVYLVGGTNVGLVEGQRLVIKHKGTDGAPAGAEIAEVQVEAVATVSAVAKVVSSNGDITPGDVACMSAADIERRKNENKAAEINSYPQVVSFTEGNPPDQEVRDSIPRPPSPEVNHIRGFISADYTGTFQPGAINSSQFGYDLRLNGARLGGSYWTASGFYRGSVVRNSTSFPEVTLRELLNRTYHLDLTYANPNSPWVAGIGRLYVPWATSLSTLDGFYFGRRRGNATFGIFGGTTPDPTSWNYDPHRELFGSFVNYAAGSFDSFKYTSTAGIAISRIRWSPDRQFGFFENGLYYKHEFSLYSDIETDYRTASEAAQNGGSSGFMFSRSFLTLRYQPHKIVSFDLSDNYFRNVPTFDPRLIGTGMLDQYLFQGISGGVHLYLPYRVGLWTDLGRSSRTNDPSSSWDYLYGASVGNIANTGLRAEFRYSKFSSSFGDGDYKSLTLSRTLGEALRFDLQVGQQDFASVLTNLGRDRFVSGDVQWLLGSRYILQGGYTAYRGQTQNYNQYFLSLGYRFDFHRTLKEEIR